MAEPQLLADFFVHRAPLLPVSRYFAPAHQAARLGAEAPDGPLAEALAADLAASRSRLQAALDDGEVREALLLASPSLLEALVHWQASPEGRKSKAAERSLVKYLGRMATRPTPFGLFAACGLGRLGKETSLQLGQERARRSRLDHGYLTELAEALSRDPVLRPQLRFRRNSSLYALRDEVRYLEGRSQAAERTYHLVALTADPALALVLSAAAEGALPGELVAQLRAAYPETPTAEAEEYVAALLDHQVLEPALTPAVTSPDELDALSSLRAQLRSISSTAAVCQRLDAAAELLGELDQSPQPGGAAERYGALEAELGALAVPITRGRLVQVDLVRPGSPAVLGAEVLAELQRGVHLLHRLCPCAEDAQLVRFREAFQARYEGEEVPLLQALDEERGIGFGGGGILRRC